MAESTLLAFWMSERACLYSCMLSYARDLRTRALAEELSMARALVHSFTASLNLRFVANLLVGPLTHELAQALIDWVRTLHIA